MTPTTYITRNGTNLTVAAVQVPDELSAVMRIAAWVYDNGGKLTDPMFTFDCAFRLGPEATPVNVGDWVVRYGDGTFAVMPDEAFAGAFEAFEAVTS